MVVIRMQRRGTKKVPHHRLVVMERSRAQNSRVLETLGHYNPATEPPTFTVNEARLAYWLSSGAQVSDAVGSLIWRFKKISVAGL